jgi:hypothetical protein
MKELLIALDENLDGLVKVLELAQSALPYTSEDITTEEERTKANQEFFETAYKWAKSILDGFVFHTIVSIKDNTVKLKQLGKEFNTGDIVKDFETAVDYAHNHSARVSYSSSVDQFVMDNHGFYFDENDLIQGNTK